jgi:hypothetical protein
MPSLLVPPRRSPFLGSAPFDSRARIPLPSPRPAATGARDRLSPIRRRSPPVAMSRSPRDSPDRRTALAGQTITRHDRPWSANLTILGFAIPPRAVLFPRRWSPRPTRRRRRPLPLPNQRLALLPQGGARPRSGLRATSPRSPRVSRGRGHRRRQNWLRTPTRDQLACLIAPALPQRAVAVRDEGNDARRDALHFRPRHVPRR